MIPCKNCIILAMCKSKPRGHPDSVIQLECSIVSDYVFKTIPDTREYATRYDEVIEFLNKKGGE